MKKGILLVLISLFFVGLITANDTIDFRTDLNEAKRQASREGKLYVVEFMRDNCYPCKMMDETTFADPQVISYIRQNYIPVKVNVESFDGLVWKEKYDIRVVPTIMVFSSRGDVVAKYEESIGSRRMYSILSEHNRPENRTNPESYLRPVPKTSAASSAISEVSAPTTTSLSYTPPPTTAANGEGIGNTEGLFEFRVKRASRSGYGVQVGVYAQYGNVLQAVERLERQFNRQILVNINTLNGQVVYKVIVGGFSSYGSASDFRRQISAQYTGHFIVDLAKI